MANFLIDASLPRAVASVLKAHSHESTDVRDIGLGQADDLSIAGYARRNRLCLITRDQDFGNIKDYPPDQYSGIVVIRAPEHAGRTFVLTMIEQFLHQQPILDALSGHLAIVEPSRIRVRPG